MKITEYEPLAGTSIDDAAQEATELAVKSGESVTFEFNGRTCTADPKCTVEENRLKFRSILGLPAVDPPFHPVTALDALERWDKGQPVFTIEMGGIGPGYEQAIQILVFELIRDLAALPLPKPDTFGGWGDATVSRVDESCGGFSGAQVGSAKQIAYRAIRDGWGKMIESSPKDRHIQVSKFFPKPPA